jgi:hypothetical protein
MKKSDRVLVEILVAAPIDVVWRALRDPQEIQRWFGWDYEGLADEIKFIFGRAEATDADYTLSAPGMPDRYVLEPNGSHTIVRLIRSAPVTDQSWNGIYDDIVEGWLTFTQQLRFMLERHAGTDRRSLYLSGRAKAAGVALPAEALGLLSLMSVPVGGRYTITMDVGDGLEGDVWFRSAYQIGLTADGYGDGLIIIGTRPMTNASPHGGGFALITTYGFDTPTFAGMHDRWSAWWHKRYEVLEIQPTLQDSRSATS